MSETTTLTVTGMTCGHCKTAVYNALEDLEGVTHVDVDLDAGRATVKGGNVKAMLDAVREEGYGAEVTA
jgi:copper chaperone